MKKLLFIVFSLLYMLNTGFSQLEVSLGYEQINESYYKENVDLSNTDYNGIVQAAYFIKGGDVVGFKPFVNARLGDYNNVKAGVLLEFRFDLMPDNEVYDISLVAAGGLIYDNYIKLSDYTAQGGVRIDYKNYFLLAEYSQNLAEAINYGAVPELRILAGYQF